MGTHRLVLFTQHTDTGHHPPTTRHTPAIMNPLSMYKPPPDATGVGMGIFVCLFAAFGGFLFGYDTGYIAGVKEMPFWLQEFGSQTPDGTYELTTSRDSLVTSILSAGTFFGALLGAPVGDFLGRRFGIIFFLMLFCIGVAAQTGGVTVAAFVVGRVFAGLGVGGVSCLVPMHQAECAPKWIRGAVVSTYQWFITIGLLIASVVVESTKDIDSAACYQIPLGIGLVFLPESPRWLIMKGKEAKAHKALSKLLRVPQDSHIVTSQYAEVASNLHHERSIGTDSYAACFKSGEAKVRKRVLTGIAIQALQQLSGINFIFYYGTTFFANSGIENPFIITIATNVVNVGMTVPGILAVDKVGRRSLLLYGAIAMAVSQIIVAAVGVGISPDNDAGNKVLIAFVCIFIGHFAAIWGPYAWVVTSEIYPTAIRAKAMSLSTASNWLWNFGIGYATPYLVDEGAGRAGLGSNVFWIWGGFCVIAAVFVFFFIPETKGLSLEQVDILYRNSSILKSNAYRKKILNEDIHNEDYEAYMGTQLKPEDKQVDEKRSL